MEQKVLQTKKDSSDDVLVLERTEFLMQFVERYRSKLVDDYVTAIHQAFESGNNTDLIHEFITDSAYILQASDVEIIEMFVEDSLDKYQESKEQDYFNQVFKVAT